MPIRKKKKGPRKIVAPTHNVTGKGKGEGTLNTQAYGKSDLFTVLREMMRDGYTTFTIDEIFPSTRLVPEQW